MRPEIIEACARAAHEVNRVYCLTLGDRSQPSWEEAPDWQKSSARNGVVGALAGNTPEQAHEAWFEEKRRTGWKYGPVKDLDKKEHPCLVPYAELPAYQQAKDRLFTGTVREMAKAMVVMAHRVKAQEIDCPGCWESKVLPALKSLSFKVYEYNADEGRLQSMPLDPDNKED